MFKYTADTIKSLIFRKKIHFTIKVQYGGYNHWFEIKKLLTQNYYLSKKMCVVFRIDS